MKSLTRGHFKAGVDSVRGAKMRNFWTVLGVVIGVASVILVVSIGEGVKVQVGGQLNRMGKDLVTVRPSALDTGGQLSLLPGGSISGSLTEKDVNTVAATKGVSLSAPLAGLGGVIKGDAGSYQALVVGTSGDLPRVINQSVAYGSFFSPDDGDMNSVVLGQKAAERLYSVAVPLGQTLTFKGRQFIVRGIFNEFPPSAATGSANYNQAVFIPYGVAQELTNNTAPTYSILVKPSSGTSPKDTAAALRTNLLKNHGGQEDFTVLTQAQNIAANSGIIDLLTKLISGVAAISLLVGGIGIMNVMLVSVTERMHEIGIRKAIGATDRQIMSQFLIESTLLSLTGGVLGIVLSAAVAGLLRTYTDIQPIISWQVVAIATGVSVAVGIIFGTVPALKAARKDPINALRAET